MAFLLQQHSLNTAPPRPAYSGIRYLQLDRDGMVHLTISKATPPATGLSRRLLQQNHLDRLGILRRHHQDDVHAGGQFAAGAVPAIPEQLVEARLKVLIENYGAGEGKIKKLVIPNIEGFEVLKIEDIIRCEGERNYTNFVLSNGKKILVSKTMKEYEELLSEHGFFRIHQSTLVNLHHVKKYFKGDGGKVEMSDGITLQVSRQRKGAFVKRFV